MHWWLPILIDFHSIEEQQVRAIDILRADLPMLQDQDRIQSGTKEPVAKSLSQLEQRSEDSAIAEGIMRIAARTRL